MTFLEAIFARLERDAAATVLQEVRDGRIEILQGATMRSTRVRKFSRRSHRNLHTARDSPASTDMMANQYRYSSLVAVVSPTRLGTN